jgi:TRAP-type uncharacterized transport system substrate-binding protein
VVATVVTSSNVRAEVIYRIVKAVFDNFDEFKALHPDFGVLSPSTMVKDGLATPIHDGALHYYKTKGWVK